MPAPCRQWQGLAERLRTAGLTIEVVPAAPGLPDLVFPANAAVVLDGICLLARFRYPERRGEEACFLAFFEDLCARGLLSEVRQLPDGVFQEGAGDCLWDSSRQVFWAAWGPRSSPATLGHIARCLRAARWSGWNWSPIATTTSTPASACCRAARSCTTRRPCRRRPGRVAERVPAPELRIAATADEAAAFSLNAVNIGRDLIMTAPPPRLAASWPNAATACSQWTCRPTSCPAEARSA